MYKLFAGGRSADSGIVARLGCAFAASAIAIAVNTALLSVADFFHLVTARGGLLSLLLREARRYVSVSPVYQTYGFQQAFHVAVGIVMGIVYAILFARLRGSAWKKGVTYGVLIWLVNACIVLPAIHQGVAGYRVLSVGGMLYFACAHMVFFLLCAVLYERFCYEFSTRNHEPGQTGERA
ncbi:hypothetical protein A6V36_17355 [Paraburkholderia ginsengiterrae]|uniref:Uncharacterized protein n=1 Tax=Paraburkholderia ginsengiterrae TaxID=1462993 RepID=A0A1A9NF16_9BURK|nr:hypothetical protein [Paraburkholderia ginsengiterrae]OAJ63781.1 hypothetical protein A6V36_17355 [Paraburkholderia ginsengiterrae]OAJ65143.1 hypothetical protein A6V37_15785 [Paraburkholderia ginsengiterrae]